MADRTRSRAKPPAGEPKPVKVLLVLGDTDDVLDPRSSPYAQKGGGKSYDNVQVVNPDGQLAPYQIKGVSTKPVALDVMDMRQPRVSVTAAWEVTLSAERSDDDGIVRAEYRCACDEAVQAIAVAISLAKRDDASVEWQVQGVRRMGEIGKL